MVIKVAEDHRSPRRNQMSFKPHRNCVTLAQEKTVATLQCFAILNKQAKILQYGLFLIVAIVLWVTKNCYLWVLEQRNIT
ncbi:Uncharacterized protein APZ42_010223, partial [Daphnia magna]